MQHLPGYLTSDFDGGTWRGGDRSQEIVSWTVERIFAYFLFSLFKLLENAWYQQKAGILDQAHWLGWESLLGKYYHSEGVREAWWPSRTNADSPEFQEFLSRTKPPDELSGLGELFD